MNRLRRQLVDYVKRLEEHDFYKNKIPKDITEENIWEFYNEFPIENKQNIVENIDKYVSKEFRDSIQEYNIHSLLSGVTDLSGNHDKRIVTPQKVWNIEFTTGSTGKPFPIVKSPKTRMIESKYLFKKRQEIYNLSDISNGFLFLHPIREDIASMNLWTFEEKDMEYIVREWERKPPKWIFATPLIFLKYAEYINKTNRTIFNHNQLEFIEYTSQSINDDEKELLSNVYRCKIISNYGSREFWNIAYQCVNGNLHVNDEYLLLNLVDDEGNIIRDYNIVGNVIITHLKNFDMPLFKYYLGDRARLLKNNCSCGCASDIIEFVPDREIYKLKNTSLYGNKVFRRVMRGLYFHDYFFDIKKVKIVQDGDYHLTVYLDKTQTNDDVFERRFIFRTSLIVPEFNKFKVDFSYSYPFSNDDYRFKEIIFKSIV